LTPSYEVAGVEIFSCGFAGDSFRGLGNLLPASGLGHPYFVNEHQALVHFDWALLTVAICEISWVEIVPFDGL
jgi:hypothetical protein